MAVKMNRTMTLEELTKEDGLLSDGDWIESKDQDPNGQVNLIQLADIKDGYYERKSSRFLTKNKAGQLNCTFLMRNDVLIARMPDPLGRASVFPGEEKESVTAVDVCIVRVNPEKCNPRWLVYSINSPQFRNQIDRLQSGTTRKRISKKNLAAIKFPFLERKGQDKIVETLETQFTRLDAAIKSLKTIKQKLEVYRKSVLKTAFEGKLSQGFEGISVDEIIKKMLKERRLYWEHKQLKKYSDKKIRPPKNWKEKYKEPKTVKTVGLKAVANDWAWTNFDHIAEFKDNAIKAGPFGSSLKKQYYVDNGYKIYGQEQVIRNDPYYGDYYINQKRFDLLKSCEVKPGDILISLVGTIGKILILPDDCEKGIINPRLVKFSLNKEVVHPKYIKYYLMSPFAVQWFQKDSHGQTMNILNLTILLELPIPLSSYQEQELIIQEIESRFSVIDKLEETVNTALLKSARLRKSILKSAFEGKLISKER